MSGAARRVIVSTCFISNLGGVGVGVRAGAGVETRARVGVRIRARG